MARYSQTLRDNRTLSPIAGADVSVIDYSGSYAVLTTDSGAALENPFKTDSYGSIVFNTSAGLYTLEYRLGSRLVQRDRDVAVGTLVAAVSPSPSDAGKFIALDADGNPTYASGTGSDAGLRPDLAAANGVNLVGGAARSAQLAANSGSTLVGFQQSGTGAITRTAEAKLRDQVTTADYATLQQAIDTGAREVVVNTQVSVSAPVVLRATLKSLRFDGGRIAVPSGAQANFNFPNAVLSNASGASDLKIINPVIDCSALADGAPGIFLTDVTGVTITNPALTKCNLLLQSSSNVTPRRTYVSGINADLQGYAGTAIYLSGIRDVTIEGGDIANGGEGVGVYNDARAIRLKSITSHDHVRDGFVVIAGQQVEHTDCQGHNNGQSGFTTQRQTSAENTRFISYKGCRADGNDYDGFDLRGANDGNLWDRDAVISASDCSASNNVGCGFYVVRAQGTKLTNCTGRLNGQQNLLVDTADRVNFANFQSLSGATAVASGTNKAGVVIFNSNMVRGDLVSGNWETVQQDYGVSITGTSVGCRITGGDLSNNSTGPFVLPSGNSISGVSGADTAAGVGYFLEGVTSRGTFRENGDGLPTHFRPKGSLAVRNDGGNGEVYVSNGLISGTPSWSRLAFAP